MSRIFAGVIPDYSVLQGKRICIVEDDADQLALLRGMLKDSGSEATYLRSGRKAWQWLAEEAVDLILIDVMMPDMDGWELCSRLRESGANRSTPIVFTTCVIRPEQETLMSDPVARTLSLAKPFKRDRLFRMLERALQPAMHSEGVH
jgi:CheY-like chemotaxis protein